MAIGETGKFDIVYIDAQKSEYLEYYDLCLQLTRTGTLHYYKDVWHYNPLCSNSKLLVIALSSSKTVSAILWVELEFTNEIRMDDQSLEEEFPYFP